MSGLIGDYTMVYYSDKKFYVRVVPIETDRFPHGLALATTFDTKADAVKFAESVEEYIKEWFTVDKLSSNLA